MAGSSTTPSFKTRPNCAVNVRQASFFSSSFASFAIMSRARFVTAFLSFVVTGEACRSSRETLSGSAFVSMRPLTNRR